MGPIAVAIPTRAAIVSAALAELGTQDPAKYWSVVMPEAGRRDYPEHWCGAFALWCWRQGGAAKGVEWTPGNGFGLAPVDITRNPQPGDIAYFVRHQHYAIVERLDGGTLYTIDGNQGTGRLVAQRIRSVDAVHAFYSVDRFLEAS